ncbi:MAG: DUF2461 domain-containing protein [Bryobacteraceae bacterium]|nr:DUF2461 domain-containing protein [Bryobacteraceae bacterium]
MDAVFVLKFLSDLSRHNDREWFATQTERYQNVRQQFQEFVTQVLLELADTRPAFGEVDPAKCIFRIHRDVRFSKNKTPYKTNISAVISEGGKNTEAPCGYFQLEPGGKSFVACGLYEPSTAELHQVRQRIAEDPTALRAILKGMKRHFPDGFTGEKSVRLRGFTPDHPAYDLLIFKSFVATRAFTDEQVIAKTFAGQLKASLKAMLPLLDWLNQARQDPHAGPRRSPGWE